MLFLCIYLFYKNKNVITIEICWNLQISVVIYLQQKVVHLKFILLNTMEDIYK